MFEVVYYSRTGNTKKVAEAIAAELEITAQDIGAAGIVAPDAFLFLGLGFTRGVLPEVVTAFMRQNRFRSRKIALFTTSVFGSETERKKIEAQLEAQGAIIVRSFKCYGRCGDINKENPTALELQKAAWFARSAAITLSSPHTERVETLSLVS
jgi:hypothetical protein